MYLYWRVRKCLKTELIDERFYIGRSSVPNLTGWNMGNRLRRCFVIDMGICVDRHGGREETAIIEHMKSYFKGRLKGAVRVFASVCFDIGAQVDSAASESNPYHANIWLDMKDRKREMLQAYYIVQHAELAYIDDNIQWNA